MIKTNLPVLLIRNMVLFPNSEVRIEIDSEVDKKVISLAEDYYDNQILIVNPKDVLEQNPDVLAEIEGKVREIIANKNKPQQEKEV